MNERIMIYKDKLVEFWQRFSTKQKIMLGSIVLFLLIALILYINISTKPDFQVLYPNLEQAEAGEVVAKLKEKGIDYQLSADGTMISIPKVHIADVIVEFAQQGIPSTGSIDASIFQENMTFGMTDAQFGVIERSAIEGELKKLIKTIEGITEASVMITMPPKDVFWSPTEETSTASVVLNLAPGTSLAPEQVNGLYLLVSKSVPNLAVEDITISDQFSNVLEQNDVMGTQGFVGGAYLQQREIQKGFQRDIQRDVQQLLGRIMGPEKVIVQVYANLNFDQRKRSEQRVEPVVDDKGIEVSVEKIQESFLGKGDTVGGTVSTESDINGYPNTTDSGNTESERNENRINYEVNRISEDIISQPFIVDDLTINVGIEPPIPSDPTSLNDDAQVAVQNILANIVRSALSDTETITDEQIMNKIEVFPHEFRGKIAFEEGASNTQNQLLWIGVGLLVALVIGGTLWSISRRRKNEEEDFLSPQTFNPQSLEIETNQSEELIVKKQLENLAKTKPNEFAKLLRTWLAEE